MWEECVDVEMCVFWGVSEQCVWLYDDYECLCNDKEVNPTTTSESYLISYKVKQTKKKFDHTHNYNIKSHQCRQFI